MHLMLKVSRVGVEVCLAAIILTPSFATQWSAHFRRPSVASRPAKDHMAAQLTQTESKLKWVVRGWWQWVDACNACVCWGDNSNPFSGQVYEVPTLHERVMYEIFVFVTLPFVHCAWTCVWECRCTKRHPGFCCRRQCCWPGPRMTAFRNIAYPLPHPYIKHCLYINTNYDLSSFGISFSSATSFTYPSCVYAWAKQDGASGDDDRFSGCCELCL